MDGSCTESDERKPNMYNFIEEIAEEAAPSLEEVILNMKFELYPLVDGMAVVAGDVVQLPRSFASLRRSTSRRFARSCKRG